MPEKDINYYVADSHKNAVLKGFWDTVLEVREYAEKGNVSEAFAENVELLAIAAKIALIHSEVSEMLEALRKDDAAEFAEETADAHIRLFDLAGFTDVKTQSEIEKKATKNAGRPKMHGKRF